MNSRVIRLHSEAGMFYVCVLWGMQVCECPVYQSLSFLPLFIIMANVAMAANLENVPSCGRRRYL